MTLYVLQFAILMRGMPIGKNVEFVPANRDIPNCSIFFYVLYATYAIFSACICFTWMSIGNSYNVLSVDFLCFYVLYANVVLF